ncbi:MAG: hypothetical protein LQ340_001292 [Diploschistes diacapsis]|nr:MAG: hypothetical protein LQ340_001292 [Diploschistes diacapsis]
MGLQPKYVRTRSSMLVDRPPVANMQEETRPDSERQGHQASKLTICMIDRSFLCFEPQAPSPQPLRVDVSLQTGPSHYPTDASFKSLEAVANTPDGSPKHPDGSRNTSSTTADASKASYSPKSSDAPKTLDAHKHSNVPKSSNVTKTSNAPEKAGALNDSNDVESSGPLKGSSALEKLDASRNSDVPKSSGASRSAAVPKQANASPKASRTQKPKDSLKPFVKQKRKLNVVSEPGVRHPPPGVPGSPITEPSKVNEHTTLPLNGLQDIVPYLLHPRKAEGSEELELPKGFEVSEEAKSFEAYQNNLSTKSPLILIASKSTRHNHDTTYTEFLNSTAVAIKDPHPISPSKTESQKIAAAPDNLFKAAASVSESQTQNAVELANAGQILDAALADVMKYDEDKDFAAKEGATEDAAGRKHRQQDQKGSQTGASSEASSNGMTFADKRATQDPKPSRSQEKGEGGADEAVAAVRTQKHTKVVQSSKERASRAGEDQAVYSTQRCIVVAQPSDKKRAFPDEEDLNATPALMDLKSSSSPPKRQKTKGKIAPRTSGSRSPSKQSTLSETSSSKVQGSRMNKKSSSTHDRDNTNVFFSTSSTLGNLGSKSKKMKDLRELGISRPEDVSKCNIFCTGPSFKKTPNFLHALVLGKPIVTDAWLEDSLKAKLLKDHSAYLARDVVQEKEWACKVREASEKFRNGLKLFEGKGIAITPALKSELGDNYGGIVAVARAAGAEDVVSRSPRTREDVEDVVWLAREKDPLLMDFPEGQRVFGKDLISMSILRAKLDLESEEFRLDIEGVKEPPKKGRRKKA